MLRRKHSLEVGQKGIVGHVTGTGFPRVALNTGEDAIYFNNPDLPDTRSEMAVPLSTRGRIIGALDVQSTSANAFTDTDVVILSLLADQIAIAIDNVQLLKESQSALSESQAVFREYLADSWKSKMGLGIIGYHQSPGGGRVLTESTLAELEMKDAGEGNVIKIPIRVRDQEIGILEIRPITADKKWNEEDLAVVQDVAERLGLTLDNARLFEETSSRASRERFVTEITSKIRSSNDPQEMIKTAVQELEHLLGATRVEIVSQRNGPPPD
jgi:GAF domain-containing protein